MRHAARAAAARSVAAQQDRRRDLAYLEPRVVIRGGAAGLARVAAGSRRRERRRYRQRDGRGGKPLHGARSAITGRKLPA